MFEPLILLTLSLALKQPKTTPSLPPTPEFVHRTNNICTNCPPHYQYFCVKFFPPTNQFTSYVLQQSTNMRNWIDILTNWDQSCDITNNLFKLHGNGFLRVKYQ